MVSIVAVPNQKHRLGNSWREQTKEPTTMTTADAIRPADDDDDDDDGEPRRRRRASRERGTPRGALPRRVSTILIVSVNAVCATLATALFLHSYSPPPLSERDDGGGGICEGGVRGLPRRGIDVGGDSVRRFDYPSPSVRRGGECDDE